MTPVISHAEEMADLLPSEVRRVPARSFTSAVDRLDVSRDNLRIALMRIAHPGQRRPMFAESYIGRLAEGAIAQVRKFPTAALVFDTAESWWRRHPLHSAVMAVAKGSAALIAPLGQRKPKGLLLFAFGVGAALVLVKPWRILKRPALVFGLLSQAMAHIAKARSAGVAVRLPRVTTEPTKVRPSAR